MFGLSKTTATALMLGSALALSACASKAPKQLPPEPAPATTTPDDGGANRIIPGSQADFVQVMAGQDTIYFDTDRYNVDSVDAAALQTQAAWLQRYPAKRATIEGHADERGTRDYNIALGERRANAAKNYLVSIGIPADRLRVVSYGKERPVALGSNESAWAQNRRAATITID